MTIEERRAAAVTVYGWLDEIHGRDVAEWWVWERTPFPCGLPLDEQLEEGLTIAVTPNPGTIRETDPNA